MSHEHSNAQHLVNIHQNYQDKANFSCHGSVNVSKANQYNVGVIDLSSSSLTIMDSKTFNEDVESNILTETKQSIESLKLTNNECNNDQERNDGLSQTLPGNETSNCVGKKKTPMCVLNELARYHKLQPQYRLIEESGPAHQKTFVINLKLGEEIYEAAGQSIKKAQHAAAEVALQKTSFRFPQFKPKIKSPISSTADKPITPTVELNALAMKLNFPPVYTSLEPVPCQKKYQDVFSYQNTTILSNEPAPICRDDRDHFDKLEPKKGLNSDFQRIAYVPTTQRFSSNLNQRYFYNRCHQVSLIHRVTLSVGDVFVTGEGPSPQAARHNAAQQALEELRRNSALFKAPSDGNGLEAEAIGEKESDPDAELKSPISLVHELALKLNQTIEFAVLSESGPPHMRNFVVQCKLGEHVTQGEGNCKKLAKKKSAEMMMNEVRKHYPNGFPRQSEGNQSIPQRLRTKTKPSVARKKPRNLVKDVSIGSHGCTLGPKSQDPISQLVQLQQARKEKEPIFTLLSEKGNPRQSPEFVVEVVVGSVKATGIGVKKKEAKRAAALKALEALGVSTTTSDLTESESTGLDPLPALPNPKSYSGRQMVPGLLLLGVNQGLKQETVNDSLDLTKETCPKTTIQTPKTSKGLRPELRLKYLAQVLEYEVEFSDFPKSKKGNFVTIVTLNTVPPQVSHGLGITMEEAHDDAAANMLKLIADGALDDVACAEEENMAGKISTSH